MNRSVKQQPQPQQQQGQVSAADQRIARRQVEFAARVGQLFGEEPAGTLVVGPRPQAPSTPAPVSRHPEALQPGAFRDAVHQLLDVSISDASPELAIRVARAALKDPKGVMLFFMRLEQLSLAIERGEQHLAEDLSRLLRGEGALSNEQLQAALVLGDEAPPHVELPEVAKLSFTAAVEWFLSEPPTTEVSGEMARVLALAATYDKALVMEFLRLADELEGVLQKGTVLLEQDFKTRLREALREAPREAR